jgi:hypothetical protein
MNAAASEWVPPTSSSNAAPFTNQHIYEDENAAEEMVQVL